VAVEKDAREALEFAVAFYDPTLSTFLSDPVTRDSIHEDSGSCGADL